MAESKLPLQTFSNALDTGVCLTDGEGRIRMTNRAMDDMLGYQEGQAIGSGYTALLQKLDRRTADQLQALFEGALDEIPEIRIRWQATEESNCYRVNAQNLRVDEWGDCRLLFFRDISDKVALRRDVEYQAGVLASLDDGLLIISPEGQISYWNAAAEKIFGFSSEEMRGKSIQSIHSEIDPDKLPKTPGKAQDTNQTLEWAFNRPDGTAIWINARLNTLSSGQDGLTGYVLIARDVTEKKQQEHELFKKQKELANIIDSQTNYLIRTDLEGNYTFANQAFLNKFHYYGDVIGKPYFPTIHPDDVDKAQQMAADCLAQPGKMIPIEIRKPAPDGGYVTNYWEFVAITDKQGKPTEIQGVGYDISEKVKSREQIDYLNRFNRLLLNISTDFINVRHHKLDEQITGAMEQVTRFTGFERSFIYLFNEDKSLGHLTHEFCMPGVPPSGPEAMVYPAEPFPWWMNKILSRQTVEIPDPEALPPEAANEKEAMKISGIRSVLAAPIFYQDDFLGYLGFTTVSHPLKWSRESGDLLKLLGAIFANAVYRSRTGKALEESRDRYKLLADNISDMISRHDKHNRIQYVSPSCRELLGYGPEEMMGNPATDFVHPHDRDTINSSLEKALSTGSGSFTARLRRKNGEYIWVESYGKIVENQEGIEYIATTRNIHQQRMAEIQKEQLLQETQVLNEQLSANEEELRQNLETTVELNQMLIRSERKFKGLLEKSFDAIVMYDANGIITYASPAAYQITGFDRLVGAHGSIFVHDDDRKQAFHIMEKVMVSPGQHIAFEQRLRQKNGQVLWIEVVMTNLLDDPAINGIVSNFRDVTERRLNEAKLKANESSLRIAQQVAKTGSWEVDLTNGVSTWSDGLYRIIGLDPGTHSPQNIDFFDYIHPEDRKRIRALTDETFAELKEVPVSYRIFDADGQLKYIDAQNKILRDESGQAFKIMGTIRDVTQETYLRQLLHDTNRIAHVGGWEVDMEQGKVTWTSETYRMHELDENQQVSLQQAIDFYHEEDRPALSEALERMTSRGEPFDLELRIISALGNKKWVRASGRGIEQRDGKIIRIRGAVQDITERKEKEEAVIKYSERLLLAAQTARIGIWELDLESGHLSWNEEQHKIYGITPAEFAADMDHWKTLVHPEDREETKAALDKARQGQEVFDVAYRIIRHDREIRYLDASARPIRDSQGRIVKLIGVNLDVTKIRQSEAAIRRYSERLTLATESAGIGIWDLNVLTSRLHWDVRTLELYGIQPEAFKGTFEEWKAAVHPDDFEAAYQSLERALETGQDYEAEFRVIRRDSGQISYMKACARVITDSNGKPLRMVGVGWDITQSKEYEKSLQTYAERMRLASASASFSVWEVNLLTNEITWNDKAYDIYGVDPDTFKINVDNWKQLLHPEDLEGALRHYQDAASGREELNNHFRVIHPGSGETRYIRSTGTLVKDEQGKVVRFIGIDMDITELKENEAQLLKKNEELTKANSELDHFVYSTSHNLRAPLTSIMGIVDVMRKLNDPEELQKFMNLIEKSIFKLDETIQEISAYSKNSRLEIQSEPIELPALIEEVADSLSFMENADRISFETDIPEKLSFHSDTGRLKIIFNNLLSNSVKYCDPRQESPYVKVSVEPQESGIKIIFSDNGIGISQQYTDRIFNMFFRATNKASGSGLGLYIVKEAVEKLGGSISIDSELSVGTTFIILLPDLP